MNIAIVGSNGFIGSHLTNYISKDKDQKLFLFGKNEDSIFNNDFPYYRVENLKQDQFESLFSKIDIVYYLASATIPANSWENPVKEIEGNLLPFLNFTERISMLSVKKIVFVSSAGTIYGPSSEKKKEHYDKQPFSPYGIIKLTIEHFLNYYKQKYEINFDIYRVSNVYGEGQKTSNGLGIINTFIENILTKQQVQVYGDGNNIRDYIYIQDVVKLLAHSMKSDLNESEIFNLASDDAYSVNELIERLRVNIPHNFEVKYSEGRKSDNPAIMLNNDKILKSNPDFKFTSIDDGIQQTYNHIKKNIAKQVP